MTPDRTKPLVIHSGKGVPAMFPGGPGQVMVSADDTSGAMGCFESRDAPGLGAALHAHSIAAELFYVVDGAYEFFVDGTWHDAKAGTFVFVPPGVAHGFRSGPDGGRKIGVFVPGGTEMQFVERLAIKNEGRHLTDNDISAFAERFNVMLVGPLPER